MKRILNNIAALAALCALLAFGACSDDNSTAPELSDEPGYQSRQFTRDDLTPEGDVVETADGYQVKGALHVETDEGQTSFVNADLNVEFDEQGRVRNVTGRAQIDVGGIPGAGYGIS